jgi:hypothetical protein
MKNTAIGVIVLVALIAIVFAPFASIWALNTLFPILAIPYNFWTWLAMLIFYGFFKTNVELKR